LIELLIKANKVEGFRHVFDDVLQFVEQDLLLSGIVKVAVNDDVVVVES